MILWQRECAKDIRSFCFLSDAVINATATSPRIIIVSLKPEPSTVSEILK